MGINAIRRKNEIVSMLDNSSEVSVSELVKAFSVSEVTIRRDLESLQEMGVLLRTYGGAVKSEEGRISGKFAFGEKEKRNVAEKRIIAREAFELINPEDTVFFDSGTTVFEIARLVRKRGVSLTVVTYSLPVVLELIRCEEVNLFLLGGFLRRRLFDFYGPFSEDQIYGLSFNRAFLGVDGISGGGGLTTTDSSTARIEEAVIKRAREIVITADSSKVGNVSLINYAESSAGEVPRLLVTDAGADASEIERIKASGFEVKIAG